tara:strand:- start:198 stop:608 length:411 start_codon:yes stop_codon:yes gene_type:complete
LAKYVVTSQSVTINSVDLSDACARAELVLNSAEVETTDFGSAGWTEVIGGLKSGALTMDFHSDFGVAGVSTTFQDLIGTVVTFEVIAGGTTASATTPAYSGSILISSFTPVAGAVGDLATFSVTFPTTGEVTYAVV